MDNKVPEVKLTLDPFAGSAAQAAGALRPLTAKGYAANSKNEYNKTVHWLTTAGKEALNND